MFQFGLLSPKRVELGGFYFMRFRPGIQVTNFRPWFWTELGRNQHRFIDTTLNNFRKYYWFGGFNVFFGIYIYTPRKSKYQTLPLGSGESFTWIILKTILCLVLDFQGTHREMIPSFTNHSQSFFFSDRATSDHGTRLCQENTSSVGLQLFTQDRRWDVIRSMIDSWCSFSLTLYA